MEARRDTAASVGRLPDAELEALLDLRPQALIVGRDDPRGRTPSVPVGFTPDPALSDDRAA